MKKIHIIGTGLIGGSMAKDIKSLYPNAKIFGIDSNSNHIKTALEIGIIDEEATIENLSNSDLTIIAIPIDSTISMVSEILDNVGDDTLVMDMGSTKTNVCEVIKTHKNRRNFLATHPIAGTEFSGPQAAIENLFKNKTMIICEVEKTAFKLQERALKLFEGLGMRIRYMDPISHDRHIAYVSHLSHISSFMLGKTVIEKEKNERDILDLAGSGFASTVRLAKSSPAMWTPIFKENKQNILDTLSEYIANLNHFKNLMENDDFEAVFNEMEQTNHIKNILNGIS